MNWFFAMFFVFGGQFCTCNIFINSAPFSSKNKWFPFFAQILTKSVLFDEFFSDVNESGTTFNEVLIYAMRPIVSCILYNKNSFE